MVHFSCDRCRKDIAAPEEPRYVVNVSISLGGDPNEITEMDLEDGGFEEISRVLSDQGEYDLPETVLPSGCRFDLCEACYRKFRKNPMGSEIVPVLNFSQN